MTAAAAAETVLVYTDGAASPNPGHAGCGYVVFNDGRSVRGHGHYLGALRTNNEAEYAGVIAALEHVKCARAAGAHGAPPYPSVLLRADSQLVVRHISGAYQVRAPSLLPLYERVQRLLLDLGRSSVRFEHVLRDRNALADALAKAAAEQQRDVLLDAMVLPLDDVAGGALRARFNGCMPWSPPPHTLELPPRKRKRKSTTAS